jgi:hypothetical protein
MDGLKVMRMFPIKDRVIAAGVLALVLLAGCKASQKHAPPPYGSTPSALSTPSTPVTSNPEKKVQLPPDSGNNMAPNILEWDETVKKHYKQPGEFTAKFTFRLTNVSAEPVAIYDTETTCQCTVAKLPSKPWVIPSGGTGEIQASIDLRKKTLSATNDIVVETSKGNRRLTVEAILP